MSDNTNEIMAFEGGAGITASSFTQGMFTTADKTNEPGRKAIANALNNAGSLAEVGDRVLKVIDIVITPGVRKARQKGQSDTPCVNTYFITTDGQAYMSQSDGIARSVQNLLTMYPNFGRSSDAGYLEIQIVSRILANGNELKSVVVL